MHGRSLTAARAQAGLTLIELMVAIALLAILAVMAYRGLDGVTRTGDRAREESDRWRAIALFFERFGSDVGQATKRPVRAGDGSLLPVWIGLPVTPSNEATAATDKITAELEFSRKSPAGSDELRLGYRLRNERIELLIWRVLDRAPSSTADVHPLLDRVKTMRIKHLDSSGIWQDAWPITDPSQVLPRAVAIELTLDDKRVLSRVFAVP